MDNKWQKIINIEKEKSYFKDIKKIIIKEYRTKEIYPSKENILKSLELTPFDDVKVVILGQDPYHQPNQAHGLSFSVKKGIKVPPSLVNIIKEINTDLKLDVDYTSGNLTHWAKQGVLLLNTILTVQRNKPLSHKEIGWQAFSDKIIEKLDESNRPKVFMLWGNSSKKKEKLIKNPKHLILKAPHPSPLSSYRGFFGCKHFSKANNFLEKNNRNKIDWEIK